MVLSQSFYIFKAKKMLVTNIDTKTGVLQSRPCSSPPFCNTQVQDMHTPEPVWYPKSKKAQKKLKTHIKKTILIPKIKI